MSSVQQDTIYVGQTVTIALSAGSLDVWTDSETLADPDTFAIQIKDQDGTLTSYAYGTDDTFVRHAAGEFEVYFTTSRPYRHVYRAVATFTGPPAFTAVFQGAFDAVPNSVI